MEGKPPARSSSPPTNFHLSRTPLQRAAITINALANSEYLTHFPVVTPEDTAHAGRIVQGLPWGVGPGMHTFAFAMSTPLSLSSSAEFMAYAALQNEVTAGAILKHWRLVKASRELATPTPIIKGAGDCTGAWDALEKCWGKKVAEDAWSDYINSERKEEGGGGEGSAPGGKGGDPRERPWKRASRDSVPIDAAAGGGGGREGPIGEARESLGPDPAPIERAVGNSGGSGSPREETRKRAYPDPTPTPSSRGPAPARPHKRTRTLNALDQNTCGENTVRHPGSARSGSCPGARGAWPEADQLEPGHDM